MKPEKISLENLATYLEETTLESGSSDKTTAILAIRNLSNSVPEP